MNISMLYLSFVFVLQIYSFHSFEIRDTDGDGFLEISSFNDLHYLSNHPELWDRDFELTNDIDASRTGWWFYNWGKGWRPIGRYSLYKKYVSEIPFKGSFQGNGYSINNLYCKRHKSNVLASGLFGLVKGSNDTIQDVSLRNARIHGVSAVGILAGEASNVIIKNCQIEGFVDGWGTVAGLLGRGSNIDIINCGTQVQVKYWESGGIFAGGLIQSKISRSYGNGELEWTSKNENLWLLEYGIISTPMPSGKEGGGFISINSGSIVRNCYACVSVKSETDESKTLGGFVFSTNSKASISNCYSVVSLKPPSESISFINIPCEYTNINSCFIILSHPPNVETIGVSYGSFSEMKNKQTYIEAGWDFEKIWDIDPDINEGYPYLRGNPPPKEIIND